MGQRATEEPARFIQVEMGEPVSVLTLDRPERANAYHQPMLNALDRALAELEEARRVSVVVVRANGRAFCGGADTQELRARGPLDALELTSQRVFRRLAGLPQVTIAAIQGPAIAGGFELALSCDLRLAAPEARFALPETALGIIPAAGGTQLLPRLVGVAKAKEIILAGKELSAEEAARLGLVAEVVGAGELRSRAWDLAQSVASRSPLALRLAKEAIDGGFRGQSGFAAETLSQALIVAMGEGSGAEQ